MPYADPEQRKIGRRLWYEKAMKEGYGKRLYARRKLYRENMELYRDALFEVLNRTSAHEAHVVASTAIEEGRAREEALAGWKRGVADAPGE